MRSLVVGCLVRYLLVRMGVRDSVFGFVVLGDWFEVEVSMGDISLKGLVVKLMVLTRVVVAVDHRGVVGVVVEVTVVDGHIVVVLSVGSQHSVVERNFMFNFVGHFGMGRPGVHMRALLMSSVMVIMVVVVLIVVVIVIHVMVILMGDFVMGIVLLTFVVLVIIMVVLFMMVVVMVSVFEVNSGVGVGHVVRLAVKRQSLELNIVMLDTVLGLRLNLVEELVI